MDDTSAHILSAYSNGDCMSQWRCVFCNNSDINASNKKVMPCLHVACSDCLQMEIVRNSLPGFQSIVTCDDCSYKIKIIDGDISCFNGVPKSFLPDLSLSDDNKNILQSDCKTLSHCCDQVFGDGALATDALIYCNSCEMLVCGTCKKVLHNEHKSTELLHMLKTKKNYMAELLQEVTSKIQRHHEKVNMLDIVKENVGTLRDELRLDIERRAEQLISIIDNRKKTVVADLDRTYSEYMTRYGENIGKLNSEVDKMVSSCEFASKVIKESIDSDILLFHNDINNRLTYLNHKIKEAQIEILNMELAKPDKGKEEAACEKLFGSLIKGNVVCGDAELQSSFLLDLQWPSSLAAFSHNTFVVAGKTGAFESSGKLSFYSRQGVLVQDHVFQDGKIPCDVICAPNGSLWVSDNLGTISKFSSSAVVLKTWENKFKGGGHLAITPTEELLVTSAEDKCVLKYDKNMSYVQSIPNPENFKLVPSCVASNSCGDVIIADHQIGAVFVFDSLGSMQLKFGGNDMKGAILRCPSDVCSDPFNNILVSDFTNDRVILISKTGQFLGYLLTNDNGISCPNFLNLDSEGHLFVGQYGGEIHVFKYLSYVKNA